MNTETPRVRFTPNEFYERLLVLRSTNPEAFARFGSATLAALQANEAAKLAAEKANQKGRHRDEG